MRHWTILDSPIGPLTLVDSGAGLSGLYFPGRAPALDGEARVSRVLYVAATQLEEYFAGHRRDFQIDLDLRGNPFKQAVWSELRQIPYGTTVSYKELAARIGRPDRIRAVGGAVGATPVPIVVPCHRVVGSDGSLTGYGGGVERKRALLDLEGGRLALL
jgi:methylated-DNA-[protein]-cysteine S-methyltransferase